jgi:hypothetical protein
MEPKVGTAQSVKRLNHGLDDRGTEAQFPYEERYFSLLHCVSTYFGTIFNGCQGLFLRMKRSRRRTDPLTSI